MIEVTISNRIWIKLKDLPKPVAQALRKKFEHSNPAYYKEVALGFYTKEPRVIKTWKHIEKDGETWFTMPRGGTDRWRDTAEEFNIDYEFVDKMCLGDISKVGGAYTGDWVTPQIFPNSKLILWDHQERIVKAILAKNQLITIAPTGAGKTSAFIDAIRQANVPAIIIVWETGLLKQWQKRIYKDLGIKEKNQGMIRGKIFRLRPITLAMQQTLNGWDDEQWSRLEGVFGFAGVDEVQKQAAATYGKTIDRFDALFRVGTSADHTRRDKKEFLTHDYFGRVGIEIPKKEMIEKGITLEVQVEAMSTNFEAAWYVDQHRPDFSELLLKIICDEERNRFIVDETQRRYKAGETLLLFSHRVEHCHTLRALLAARGITAEYMLGGVKNEAEYAKTVDRMCDLKDPLRVAIGTLGKVGTALDIPNLTCGIATTPTHNNKQFMNQMGGRICRSSEGKTAAKLIYMWDRNVFGQQPLMNLKRWNKYVKVWHAPDWIEVKEYLKGYNDEAKSKDSFGPFSIGKS